MPTAYNCNYNSKKPIFYISSALLITSVIIEPDISNAKEAVDNISSNKKVTTVTNNEFSIPKFFTKKTYNVEMRDGVLLATDVYKPLKSDKYPVVVIRTPYNKNHDDHILNTVERYSNDGYVVVTQDIRGRYSSGGEYEAFRSDGWGDHQDGYDTIEWIANQSWSNGKVCMVGASARGIATYLAAGSNPPHLTCAFAQFAGGDLYDLSYPSGAYRYEFLDGWLTLMREKEQLELLQDHYLYDEIWEPVSLPNRYSEIKVPFFHAGGWFDPLREGNLDAFNGLRENGNESIRDSQWMLFGPWGHVTNDSQEQGDIIFPENSLVDLFAYEKKWVEYWLKGIDNGMMQVPKIQYYAMSATENSDNTTTNIWKTSDTWPPNNTKTTFYLTSNNELQASSVPEYGELSYIYDPTKPIRTIGGNNLVYPGGPKDQSENEDRNDVLVFTSEVLETPLEIAGKITANLFVSSEGIDTDFNVKITDVYPDGRSILITDATARMRNWQSGSIETFMIPGEIYEIDFLIGNTAMTFLAGHQIRVTIASSNYPRYSVNPNIEDMFSTTDYEIVENTVYLNSYYPSSISLPVISSD